MAERLEVPGPDGPVVIEVTDAALAERGRAGAIADAVARLAPPAPTPALGAEE